jgi:hypothetical protein
LGNILNLIKLTTAFFLLLIVSCTTEPNSGSGDEKTKWENIPELDGVDVWDVKIYNDELYIAGRDINGKGVIYKSTDGVNWEGVAPAIGDSLNYGVGAIEFYNNNLIACATGKPIYTVINDKVKPLTKPLMNDVREMIVDSENNILVGSYRPSIVYNYVTNDSIYKVYDLLFTGSQGECYKQPGTQGSVSVSSFLREKNTDAILIGNFSLNYHFVTLFKNGTIECFPTDGLSSEDRFHGCHDILYINDILFVAGGKGTIKYLNNNEWKTYGDSLPKTPDNIFTVPTAITYDETQNEIYVAVNYVGIVKWDRNSGWIKLNDGLVSIQGYYDFIPNLTYYKDKLILMYGTGKNYQSSSRGIRYYQLIK